MHDCGTVVVLGGSCFMGRRLSQRLAAAAPRVRFVVVNRGKTYWGEPLQHPHICADRSDRGGWIAAFAPLRGATVTVVDFSCDDESMLHLMADCLSQFEMVLQQYILISTDSVYSGRALEWVREDDAEFQPEDGPRGLCSEYSCNKACIDRAARQRFGDRLLALRLPDVLGPWDDSNRYLATLLAVAADAAFLFPQELVGMRVSFVYSEDVVELVMRMLESPVFGVFNIASAPIDLDAFTLAVARSINPDATLKLTQKGHDDYFDTCDFYPSVDCGPVCCDAAVARLAWQPTAISEIVLASTRFFLSVSPSLAEFQRAVKKIPKRLRAAAKSRWPPVVGQN